MNSQFDLLEDRDNERTLARTQASVLAFQMPTLTGKPETLAKPLLDYAAGLDHVQHWLEPNTVAGYEAFGRVLESLDQG